MEKFSKKLEKGIFHAAQLPGGGLFHNRGFGELVGHGRTDGVGVTKCAGNKKGVGSPFSFGDAGGS